MRTCALYLKSMTPDQSLDEEYVRLRKVAARRQLQVVAEYNDRCPFGNARRRGLEALLVDARRKKFDVIVVPSLGTMFRSTRELLQMMDDLQKWCVGLIATKEGLNTAGRSARSVSRVLEGIAGLEADLRRERVSFGIYLRRLQGFSVGRQTVNINRKALVADRLAGMSLTDVAKKYGISRASVVRFTREERSKNNGRI